jgi:tetratricopeptide (TPR) repeat protein
MLISDIYPVKASYDEPIEYSEEEKLRMEENEIRYRKELESGDIMGALGIVLTHYCNKERREEILDLCDFMLTHSSFTHSHCVAYYVQAGLCIPEENYDKAIEILLKGRERYPTNDYILSGLFYTYYHINDFAKALEVVLIEYEIYHAKHYKDTPEVHDIEYCQKIGLCYGQIDQIETALMWFKRGLTAPNASQDILSEVYYQIGVCWQRFDDEYRALGAYTKSIELNPMRPEAYNNLSSLTYNHNGNVKEAIELLKKSLEIFDDENDELTKLVWQNLKAMYATILDYENEAYAHYKVICCMGYGFLFTDPSTPEGNYEEFLPHIFGPIEDHSFDYDSSSEMDEFEEKEYEENEDDYDEVEENDVEENDESEDNSDGNNDANELDDETLESI